MPPKDKSRVRGSSRRKKISRMALPSTGAANVEVESVNDDASGKMMCYSCGAISTRDYLGIWDVHDRSTWTYGVVKPECDNCGVAGELMRVRASFSISCCAGLIVKE